MKLKNFCKIKAIDEARAKKIIKWYEETHYEVSIGAGVGITLDPLSLIRLLDVFGNSKNIDKSFGRLIDDLFEENREENH